MKPDDWSLYEFCVLRYVPDVARGEFVNVGLLMLCKRRKWLRAQIKVDARRVLAIFPGADVEELLRQLAMFERTDVPHPELPVEERYRWMAAVKSAVIQTSGSHPGICNEDLDAEFRSLVERFL